MKLYNKFLYLVRYKFNELNIEIMIYTLKHTTWFGNRPIYKKNQFGITPSSKFIYKEYEMETYKNSCSMMSQALLYVSNQITKNTAQL